jgi:hypothetical protein
MGSREGEKKWLDDKKTNEGEVAHTVDSKEEEERGRMKDGTPDKRCKAIRH